MALSVGDTLPDIPLKTNGPEGPEDVHTGELFAGKRVNVEIELASDLTRGMTVADWWGVTDRAPNALFIGDLDADGFFTLLTERLARL